MSNTSQTSERFLSATCASGRHTCGGQPRWKRRLRAALASGAMAAVALVGSVAIATPAATAADGRLETNAMASIVTTSAREALTAFDEWEATGDPGAWRSYVWNRTRTAQFAAAELGYSGAEMAAAWARTPLDHQRAVLAAMTQVGVPYRRNTSQEGVGFDCSGLTTYAWAKADVTLVRQSSAQIRNAKALDRSGAKAGDLAQYPGHVMMYLGVGDAIVHSVQPGRTVELDLISERRTDSVKFGDPT